MSTLSVRLPNSLHNQLRELATGSVTLGLLKRHKEEREMTSVGNSVIILWSAITTWHVKNELHWLRASRIKSTATWTVPILCRSSSRIRFISSRALRSVSGSRTSVLAAARLASNL